METSFNNPSGWVRLHRSLFNSYVTADPVRFYRYCDLLAMAAYDDSATVWTGTRQLRLSAGQFVASQSYLANRWGISTIAARKFMQTLEKHGFISRSLVDGISVYTIADPERYSAEASEGYEQVDQSTTNVSEAKDTIASEEVTSRVTGGVTAKVTDRVTGKVTQYKEVRNKKEEKENIYIERVRAERESLNNFIVSFFASQSDDLIRFASGLGQTVEGLRALAEEIASEWRLGGVTHENEEAARRHLVNMLRIKAEAKKKRRSTTRRKPELPDRLKVTSKPEDYYASFV